MKRAARICMVPELDGVGGPVIFQRKFAEGLRARGISVTYDTVDNSYDAILVINGTRYLRRLHRCKKRGVRIVQRLGLPNSTSRCPGRGLRQSIIAAIRNLIMRHVRARIADCVVYQSHFVQRQWEDEYGAAGVPSLVVYNGVDLNHFCPSGDSHRSAAETCIASVEGTQGTDPYDMAVGLTRALAAKGMHVELLVCGKPWKDTESRFLRHSFVRFLGVIPNADLPRIYRAAALMISTDIIAACPNSVIEALACGTPVLGYDRGVLPELVRASAGKCVPSIGEVGKGTFAGNTEALVEAALDLIARQDFYRSGARRLAEESHDLDRMIDAYIKALLP